MTPSTSVVYQVLDGPLHILMVFRAERVHVVMCSPCMDCMIFCVHIDPLESSVMGAPVPAGDVCYLPILC